MLLRMLSLGLGAWHVIDSQVFKEPKLVSASDCQFFLIFLIYNFRESVVLSQRVLVGHIYIYIYLIISTTNQNSYTIENKGIIYQVHVFI